MKGKSRRYAVLMSVIILALIGTMSVFAFANAQQGTTNTYQPLIPNRNTEYVAVMSAFSSELNAVLKGMTVEYSRTIMGTTYYFTHMDSTPGVKYIAFLTNVSMVNAAATTQKTFMLFPIKYLVFSGIAGGVDRHFNIGDVVAPAKWIQYQENVLAKEVSGTYKLNPWQSSPFKNYNERFISPVDVGGGNEKVWFNVPNWMIEKAKNISVTLESCTASNVCLTEQPKFFVGGTGGSSQSFLDNAQIGAYLYDYVTTTATTPYNYFGEMTTTLHMDAIDMESASAAQVCYMMGKDCIQFRSLSDLAGGGPGANEIGTFFQLAANNSARVLIAYLQELAK